MFCLPVDPLLFRHNFSSCDATPNTTLTRTMSLHMAWANKTRRKMFICSFYTPSVLHNADTHTHAKRHQNPIEIDVASLTSSLSALPAIVRNASILNLLNFVFISRCEYHRTLSSTQILFSFVYTSFRRFAFIKKKTKKQNKKR